MFFNVRYSISWNLQTFRNLVLVPKKPHARHLLSQVDPYCTLAGKVKRNRSETKDGCRSRWETRELRNEADRRNKSADPNIISSIELHLVELRQSPDT